MAKMTKRKSTQKKKPTTKPVLRSAAKSGAKNRKKSSTKRVPRDAQRTTESIGPASSLNERDRRLLGLLQQDARMSNLALAEAVGLSPAACHERVRKLIAQGWVTDFHAQLNAEALGQGLVVFTDLVIDPASPKTLDALQKSVDSCPQVMECHRVTGDGDVMLKVRCSDLSEYQTLLDQIIMPVRGIEKITSRVCLSTLKHANLVPI